MISVTARTFDHVLDEHGTDGDISLDRELFVVRAAEAAKGEGKSWSSVSGGRAVKSTEPIRRRVK